MQTGTILLAGIRPHIEAKLRAAIQDLELTHLPDGRPTRESLREMGAGAALVSLEGDLESRFRLVRELAGMGIRVVVLGPTKDADLILRSMREGAKEFAVADDDKAIAHVLREQVRPPRAPDAGVVYAVFPAKGGVGATTLATNLAGVLQRAGDRACLLDLNLNMGDVLAFLDLTGGYSISDIIANMRRFDRQLLESTLLKHHSGIHVLAQSHRVEESDRVDPAALSSLITFLRQHYKAVVLDGLRNFDDVSLAALDAADQILLVVSQEVPAVRDARRCVELFRRLGGDGKLKLVVNRFQKGLEISSEVIADTVGVPVAAKIANDYPAVIRAVNRGQMLVEDAPRAQVTRDVESLAALLGRAKLTEPIRENRSLFKRIFVPRASHATE